MANRVIPTPPDADNPAGSCTLAACTDWRDGVRRFHVGTGHFKPTHDAGYTTAGSPLPPQLSINLFLLGGSPYTLVRPRGAARSPKRLVHRFQALATLAHGLQQPHLYLDHCRSALKKRSRHAESELCSDRRSGNNSRSAFAACRAAKAATSTIPILMLCVGDPVGFGLVKSISRPGGSGTGISNITPRLAASGWSS